MKKIFLLAVLITAYTFATAQQTLVEPKTTTIIVLDSTQVGNVDTSEVKEYLTLLNAWFSGCGADGLALAKRGKEIGLNVKDIFKGLPLPTTQEGVAAWVDQIGVVFGGLGSIVVALLTFGLSLFKKDPEKAVTAVQTVFNKIRTRYLLVFSAIVVSGVGAFYFNDGKFGLSTVFSWLGLALGVTVGGIGFKGLLEIFGINIGAKKVAKA